MSNIIERVFLQFLRFTNPVKWARRIGVKVGDNSTISSSTDFSSEPYLITIGRNVQVTHNVSFFTHGGAHVARNVDDKFDFFGKIVIGDDTYIGSNSMIMPGVNIGKSCLIAAGSIVTKSVNDYTVVGGNPARKLCTVNEFIEKNQKFNIGTAKLSGNEKKNILTRLDEDKFIRK